MTVAQTPPARRRGPLPELARAWVRSSSLDDHWLDPDHDYEEDAYVPPSDHIGYEFWPTNVHFTLDRDHVAWGDRQAKLEILRAVEFLALRRPFHLPPIVPSRPDYKGLVTTAMAGRMSPRTWEVLQEGPRVYRLTCISLGPWLTVKQRQDRLDGQGAHYWMARDPVQTSLWMSTFGLNMYTPEPLERFSPELEDEEDLRLP